MRLLDRIASHARTRPGDLALHGAEGELSYGALPREIHGIAAKLRGLRISTLGLDLDNGPAWAVLDLAALSAGVTLVPIPPFFSPQQVRHCLKQAGVQAVISDNPERFPVRAGYALTGSAGHLEIMEKRLAVFEAVGEGDRVPQGIAKVTYTSGTTGEPKGVMLEWDRVETVADSLASLVSVERGDRHLCLMPLSVLLENIAGLYVPLWEGAAVLLPPLAETGVKGASAVDAGQMLGCLRSFRATTAILTPQTLQRLVEAFEAGAPLPAQLRFAALGGAPVSFSLLERARRLGLPVYEGYGLSECASVTTLNTKLHHKAGSVGRPLPHMKLAISEDGEVLVAGNIVSGYLGDGTPGLEGDWWRTGDIGHLDEDGFLYLSGRKRNVFITAFGRNVSPDWVESELVLEESVGQAMVFGEARPWNTAVIVTAPGTAVDSVSAALARVNRRLPDYARVSRWLIADEPFTPENGLLSGTGRIRRREIYSRYRQRIESMYQEELVS